MHPRLWVVIVSIFAYIGLGSLAVPLLEDVPRYWRPGAMSLFGLTYLAGWVWLIAGVMLGSARDGFDLLRWWVALMGGMFIALGPFVLLPHPAMIVVGVVLGIAFGRWVGMGTAGAKPARSPQ